MSYVKVSNTKDGPARRYSVSPPSHLTQVCVDRHIHNNAQLNRLLRVPIRCRRAKIMIIIQGFLRNCHKIVSFLRNSNIPGALLRGQVPLPATLAHKEELNKMRLNEVDREVHGFRCKLATCTCQELHGPRKLPGRRMQRRNRKNGEKEHRQCTGHSRQLSFSVNGCIVL